MGSLREDMRRNLRVYFFLHREVSRLQRCTGQGEKYSFLGGMCE